MSKIISKLEKDRADAIKMSEKLFETVESAIYQLDKLEYLLDMPKRGCTRNHFNALMRTLKEGQISKIQDNEREKEGRK